MIVICINHRKKKIIRLTLKRGAQSLHHYINVITRRGSRRLEVNIQISHEIG